MHALINIESLLNVESVTLLVSHMVDHCPLLGHALLKQVFPLPLPLLHRAKHAHLAGDRAGNKERRRHLRALNMGIKTLEGEATRAQQHGGSAHALKRPLTVTCDLGAMEDLWERRRRGGGLLFRDSLEGAAESFFVDDQEMKLEDEQMFPYYEE